MFNNTKSLLWLFCSVAFCVGALLFTTSSLSIQGAVLDNLVPFTQVQKRIVSVGNPELAEEKYSGIQILYSLRNLYTIGATVEVDDLLIEFVDSDEDNLEAPPLIRDPSIIDLTAEYGVSYIYNDVGYLNKITFHRK